MRNSDDGYSSKSKRPFGRIETFYIYRDEKGALYGRVTRTTTKRFVQARWENGEWVNKAPRPKIPYRLPEMVAAPLSEPVFICEGEKDADNVAALGFIATTNPGGGIPGAWSSDLNKWFAGRTIYIYEDHDKTGGTTPTRSPPSKGLQRKSVLSSFMTCRKAATFRTGSRKAGIKRSCSSGPRPGASRTKAIRLSALWT
jgi:(2Fe-2S) ferredoxin